MGMSRAMVATDPHALEARELPLPEVGPDDGLLRVEAAAICGTDYEIWGRSSRGSGLGPLILGHENVGRIARIGAEASRRWHVGEGDLVAVEEFLPCGTCRMCRSGEYRLCPETDSRGSAPFLRYGSTPLTVAPALYGGFADYLYLHPRSIVYRVDESLEPEVAALYVPIGNGVRWVTQEGGSRVGETVVVIGPGQHGLGCVIAAREGGAGKIVVVGTDADAHRLEVAKALGADVTVATESSDEATQVIMDATGGAGADVVVDLAPGAVSTVDTALRVAAKRGRVVLAASKHGRPIAAFNHDLVVRREILVRGVRGHDHKSVEPALEIIASGRYPLELLCTHRFPLAETEQALRLAGGRADPGAIHVSVLPRLEATA
jgi:threonine dehydrogenase-like Zn-dependent dehydrogenase